MAWQRTTPSRTKGARYTPSDKTERISKAKAHGAGRKCRRSVKGQRKHMRKEM